MCWCLRGVRAIAAATDAERQRLGFVATAPEQLVVPGHPVRFRIGRLRGEGPRAPHGPESIDGVILGSVAPSWSLRPLDLNDGPASAAIQRTGPFPLPRFGQRRRSAPRRSMSPTRLPVRASTPPDPLSQIRPGRGAIVDGSTQGHRGRWGFGSDHRSLNRAAQPTGRLHPVSRWGLEGEVRHMVAARSVGALAGDLRVRVHGNPLAKGHRVTLDVIRARFGKDTTTMALDQPALTDPLDALRSGRISTSRARRCSSCSKLHRAGSEPSDRCWPPERTNGRTPHRNGRRRRCCHPSWRCRARDPQSGVRAASTRRGWNLASGSTGRRGGR
jgi:hypothetical protein